MKKISGLVLLFLCSCAVRSVYVPTTQNIILPGDKKIIRTNAYLGTNHAEFQLGLHALDHILLGTNINFGKGLNIYEGFTGYSGYNIDQQWRYEIQVGGGYNYNFLHQDNPWFSFLKEQKLNYDTRSEYYKYFLQPSFGYFSKMEIYKLNYSFSLSCRVSYLDFKKYIYREFSQLSVNSTTNYSLNIDYRNKGLYLFEPSITNKVGMKNIDIVMQGLFMIPQSKQIDVSYTKFSPVFIFSLGLQYSIPLKNK